MKNLIALTALVSLLFLPQSKIHAAKFSPISSTPYTYLCSLRTILDPSSDPDTDGDGITDCYEKHKYGTKPDVADTDGDGLQDGYEVKVSHTNPKIPNPGLAVTYYKDIKPIFEAHCVQCHGPGGIRSDLSWTSYEEITKDDFIYLDWIKESVLTKEMPPWPPDNTCGPQILHNRALSEDQIQKIQTWVDQKAPQGVPSDEAVGAPPTPVGLSRVDLSIQMPQAYQPTLQPDEYRCFILDWPATEMKYVSGFQAVPGQPTIDHHAIAYSIPPDKVADYQSLDAQDPNPGYPCFGSPGSNVMMLGAWAPGELGTDYPAGTGIKVLPGSKIALQMHYHLHDDPSFVSDQTTLNLKLEDQVQKEAQLIFWTDVGWVIGGLEIPPNQLDFAASFLWDLTQNLFFSSAPSGIVGMDKPFQIYGAGLHMHELGKSGSLSIQPSIQTEDSQQSENCLFKIPRWDFHWQGLYFFEAPFTYNVGDQLKLECRWNNDTMEEVTWGNGSSDEMCLAILYVVAADEPPLPVCGDGAVHNELGEECDDGNTSDGDGCSATCQTEFPVQPVCGDGALNGTDQCDDGNVTDGDGCSSSCTIESSSPVCGDGVIEGIESCDDGNAATEVCDYGQESCTVCSATCQEEAGAVSFCGDGVSQTGSGEGCDDGNQTDGDGCSAQCQTETGGGGTDTGGDTSGNGDDGGDAGGDDSTGGDSSSGGDTGGVTPNEGAHTEGSGQIIPIDLGDPFENRGGGGCQLLLSKESPQYSQILMTGIALIGLLIVRRYSKKGL